MQCPNLFELQMFVLERKFLRDIVPKEFNDEIGKHVQSCTNCARTVKKILALYDGETVVEENVEEVAVRLQELEGDKEGTVEVVPRLKPSLA